MNKIRKEIKKDTKIILRVQNSIGGTILLIQKQTGHKLDLPKNLVKNGKLVKTNN